MYSDMEKETVSATWGRKRMLPVNKQVWGWGA